MLQSRNCARGIRSRWELEESSGLPSGETGRAMARIDDATLIEISRHPLTLGEQLQQWRNRFSFAAAFARIHPIPDSRTHCRLGFLVGSSLSTCSAPETQTQMPAPAPPPSAGSSCSSMSVIRYQSSARREICATPDPVDGN